MDKSRVLFFRPGGLSPVQTFGGVFFELLCRFHANPRVLNFQIRRGFQVRNRKEIPSTGVSGLRASWERAPKVSVVMDDFREKFARVFKKSPAQLLLFEFDLNKR